MKLPVVSAALLAAVMADAVSAAAQDVPAQGGRMIVTYQDDITTLDPAIGYDWQNPAMMQAIFDGLMDYRPGTTELTPDLAESYAISEDGRTYTFKLRQGVKFHNGRVLTAADVKYTLDRLANPATQSPGQPYFSAIKGYDEFVAGAASDLSGVATPDDHTVVIEMS
ncbi:MAG: ABC transporter substrate-binding protein, partial [Aestuariivirga sp.]